MYNNYEIHEGDVYENEVYTIVIKEVKGGNITYEWNSKLSVTPHWKTDMIYTGNNCFINDSSMEYVRVKEVRIYLDDSLFEVE